MTNSEPDKKNKEIFKDASVLFLVGMHSILLGWFIYFYTDAFYDFFFATRVENLFFVRQSGTFLFLAGFFYLYPLLNLRKLYNLILLVIFSKIVAVIFLISNAGHTAAPHMIYLAAFFDGLMGLVLVIVYFRVKKTAHLTKSNIIRAENAGLKKAADRVSL